MSATLSLSSADAPMMTAPSPLWTRRLWLLEAPRLRRLSVGVMSAPEQCTLVSHATLDERAARYACQGKQLLCMWLIGSQCLRSMQEPAAGRLEAGRTCKGVAVVERPPRVLLRLRNAVRLCVRAAQALHHAVVGSNESSLLQTLQQQAQWVLC